MKVYAISIKGVFKGIYEWGVGFVSREMQRKWDEFWNYHYSKRYAYWKYVPGNSIGECGHLMSTTHCIYLHPMDFHAVLVNDGCCCHNAFREEGGKMVRTVSHFYTELETLKEACDECAKYCGVKFEMYVSGPETELEIPYAGIQVVDKEDLSVIEVPYKS